MLIGFALLLLASCNQEPGDDAEERKAPSKRKVDEPSRSPKVDSEAGNTPAPTVAPPRAPPASAKPAPAPKQVRDPKPRAAPPVASPGGRKSPPKRGKGGDLKTRMEAALEALGPDYKPRTHHHKADGSPTFINRLIFEGSPYLLQHAHNPVNWYPWGPEAFAEAKRLDRPILLSVGYATCHWCHVMEKESFEDLEIARFMSDNFVCIKVDREERPDVDSVYMDAVHMLHGRGGWPMTVVMTPDREPFFGGTYFPPRDGARGSRKGFLTILGELKGQFTNDRANIVAKAKQISRRIAAESAARPAAGVPDHAALKRTADRFVAIHDRVWGGFGRQPKFPRPVSMEFLLQYHRRTGEAAVLDAVTKTLDKMAAGGIHDHLAGGFHRYSVDTRWLVPHFEKMLYDNAQLTNLYLNAHQVTGRADYAWVARRILEYVAREMVDPEGGFWSATDADSEGHEGTFFVWKPKEMKALLGPDLAKVAMAFWGVTERGNFEGKNILNTPRAGAAVAGELGLSTTELSEKLEKARTILYTARLKRIPPLTDDKITTSWNGLMISAFARGALVLNEPRYAEYAGTAANFVLTKLMKDGRLLRRYRGAARYRAYVEDYAFLGQGLLDLYEATGEPGWLRQTVALHDKLAKHYEDPSAGGFYRTSDDAEKLLARQKPDYDGAQPSGNSIAARNLLRLYEYTGDQRWRQLAERTLKWAAARVQRAGPAVPAMLSALDHYLDKTRQVIVVRAPGDDGKALLDVLRKAYLPNRMVAVTDADKVATLKTVIPAVANKKPIAGRTTAYVCEEGICKRPTSDPAVFAKQLAETRPYASPGAAPAP